MSTLHKPGILPWVSFAYQSARRLEGIPLASLSNMNSSRSVDKHAYCSTPTQIDRELAQTQQQQSIFQSGDASNITVRQILRNILTNKRVCLKRAAGISWSHQFG